MTTPRDERPVNRIRYNKHIRRKNNDIVAAMYAMYLMGPEGKPCSLEQVGRVYKKTRQAVYDVFRSRGYELRSKKLAGLTVLDGIRFTLMKGGYLRGTTPRGRMTMQRYVWERSRGPVPEGFVIWHRDGDKTRNTLSNLELVALGDMQRKFNPAGRNQFSPK